MSFWQEEGNPTQATYLSVGVVGSGAQENVAAAREALEPLVHDLQSELRASDSEARAILTGSAITRHEQLRAITRALFVALPISLILCLLLGALFMRSLRLGAVSIVPIMAVAPMPMFATYGFLTAVMIAMALLATLAVLPGLLMLVAVAPSAEVAAA